MRDAVAGDKGEPTLDDVKLMRQFWFDGDAQFAPISTLSGGERRRLQLLLTLIEQPNVLLLDEPTNDLDLDTLRALEEFLDDWPGIVVVVSHDRVFLDRTVSEVLALDGNGRAAVVRGGVAGWLAQHAARPTGAAGTAGRRPAPRRNGSRRLPRRSPCRRRARARCAISSGVADRELADAIAARDEVQAELVAAGADHKELARLGAQLADQPEPRRRRRGALARHWPTRPNHSAWTSRTLRAHVRGEVLAGKRPAARDEIGGRALEHNATTVVTGAGAEIDEPVHVRHHRLVVLDDDHRLARVDEPVEQAEQLLDVGEVQTRRRLVEHEDAALLRHVRGELEPLALAARQRGKRLADREVAEPDVGEATEDRVAAASRAGPSAKNASASPTDVASTSLMSLPPNSYSRTSATNRLPSHTSHGAATPGHHREVGVDHARAVAVGAHARRSSREQRRLHAVRLRERFADRVEQPGVRRGVAAPRALDGRLVTVTTPSRPDTDPVISELLPEPATPVTTASTPSGMSTFTFFRLCRLAPRT